MLQSLSRPDDSLDRRPLPALLTTLLRDSSVFRAADEVAQARSGNTVRLSRTEVRRHVTVFVEVLMASMSQSGPALTEAGHAADRLALDSVDAGVDLPALLEAVGAGRTVVVTGLVAAGRDLLGADAMLSLVPALDEAAARAHDRIVVAFREAELRRSRTTRSRRSDALRHLLKDGSGIWAREAGLDPARGYHVLVADMATPVRVGAPIALLDRTDAVSTVLDGVACTILTDPPPATPGVLCVISPRVRPADIPMAYAHCRQALHVRRTGGEPRRHDLLDLVLDLATDRIPWLGETLGAAYLSAVDPADDRHRMLVTTAIAHLEGGRRSDITAQRLGVHRNTVKYRLRRLQDLLPENGPRLDAEDLLDQFRLWWALSAWDPGSRPGGPARP